jgi:chromosome segregation ATPase
MTTDASDLRTMAESVSKRTEWIETELRKQGGQGGKTKADVEEARTKIMSLSGELQGALSNSMSLSRELAAAKEQIHKHEKQAIQIAADAKRYQDALKVAQDKLKELEADERAAQSEIAELRAELAESWALSGGRMGENQPAPSEPVVLIEQTELTDVQARAQRIEEDLRFERMHVQQLERRLNSWTGLASAALRKITRLGGKSPSRRPASPRRLNSTTAASRT